MNLSRTCHTVSHTVSHAHVTPVVTVPPTRPDPTHSYSYGLLLTQSPIHDRNWRARADVMDGRYATDSRWPA